MAGPDADTTARPGSTATPAGPAAPVTAGSRGTASRSTSGRTGAETAPPTPVPTAAVVLAAGAGTRFAGPTHKLLAPLEGRRLIDHAVDAARRAGLDATYVVTGGVAIDPPAGVEVVPNEVWAEGLATSLAAGIAAARAAGHLAVVIGLGDAPGATSEAWRRVAAATEAPVAVATYEGGRGHPVRLAAEVWDLLHHHRRHRGPGAPLGAARARRRGPLPRLAGRHRHHGGPDPVELIEWS